MGCSHNGAEQPYVSRTSEKARQETNFDRGIAQVLTNAVDPWKTDEHSEAAKNVAPSKNGILTVLISTLTDGQGIEVDCVNLAGLSKAKCSLPINSRISDLQTMFETQLKLEAVTFIADDNQMALPTASLKDYARLVASPQNGRQTLHNAARDGNLDIVLDLLAKGQSVNGLSPQETDPVGDCGNTPLHHAAQMGRFEVCEVLLAANADLEVRNYQGYTPFAVARDWSPDPKVVDLLRAHAEANASKIDRCTWNR